jgi:hypothetical protein
VSTTGRKKQEMSRGILLTFSVLHQYIVFEPL